MLAIALPAAHVALVESVARKCALPRAARSTALGLRNVEVVHARAEAWPEGLGAHDLVTARALAPLPVLVEYAAPLLEPGGALVAWKGRRDAGRGGRRRGGRGGVGMSAPRRCAVEPSRVPATATCYLSSKVEPTPAALSRAARGWPANGRSKPRVEGDGASAPNEEVARSDRRRR